MDDVLDSQEAANFLKINEYTLRRMARDGQVPAFKVGTNWRFRLADLERWIERQQHKPAPQPKILVIDDEGMVRDMLQRMLNNQGYSVDTAAGGAEGLAKIRNDRPNLVLLDLMMPEMDGPEVLRRIREYDRDLAVIIITAYPESSLVIRAMEHGAITMLSKPFAVDELLRCLNAHCPRPSGA